ncbi:MAG: hypothetical protein AAFU54_30005 [Chloroflexota bacterium]
MEKLETNIFRIGNLSALSADYRQYRVKGLSPTHRDYYRNRKRIEKALSYRLQHPVLIIERDLFPYVVVRDDLQLEMPQRLSIVRSNSVTFEPRDEVYRLNFARRTSVEDSIAIRFLQFNLQGQIRQHKNLWQTQSGRPFYRKQPVDSYGGRLMYRGFSVRPVVTNDGGIGLCVDVTSKVLSERPLPQQLKRGDFDKWRYQRCIFHYGNQWFEIQVDSLSDYTFGEHLITDDEGNEITLQHFITENASGPLSPEITKLSAEGSVVVYYNNRDEERAAPTALCYPIYGTDDHKTSKLHRRSILHPDVRRTEIHGIVRDFMSDICMGDQPLEIDSNPIEITRKSFQVPNLEFADNQILSTASSDTSLSKLGDSRKAMLEKAGFIVQQRLDRQYLILPASVKQSWGEQFNADLIKEVNRQYPIGDYSPKIVSYDDSGSKNYAQQGRKLRSFIRNKKWKPGYAVVMLHHTKDRKLRDEDALAALVIDELRRKGVTASVIHTDTGQECYQYFEDESGDASYQWSQKTRGKLRGYLKNTALSKILLTNWRWPFALGSSLNADLTIGLDVKNNTAGLVSVSKDGKTIRAFQDKSNQSEKLLEGQAREYFQRAISEAIDSATDSIKSIVVHRDGIAYESEIAGIQQAIQNLKDEGKLSDDATVTILEIAKSAISQTRLFKPIDDGKTVTNPQVGDYMMLDLQNAYLCSTGRAFYHKGTSKPLHVRYVGGDLSFEQCLEDLYSLTVLAWTNPGDCSRFPITITLNDRFLRDTATDYDDDAIRFSELQDEDLAT